MPVPPIAIPGKQPGPQPGPQPGRPRVRLFYAAPAALSLMLGKFCFALAAAQAVPAPASASAAHDLSAAERVFLAAQDAYAKNRSSDLLAAESRLRSLDADFPLLGYATSWRLMAGLAKADDYALGERRQFEEFLDANAGAPYADVLLREWLRALGRRDAVALFEARLPKLALDDAEIACHAWRFRLLRGDAEAAAEARSFWKSARAAPPPCYELFATLAEGGKIGAEEAWPRVRKLFDANLIADARKSAALIRGLPAPFERQSAQIILDPLRVLQREKFDPGSRAATELFLFAVTRAARADAGRAAEILRRRAAEFPAETQGYAWAQVALAAAMQQRAETLDYYARARLAAPGATLSEAQAAWKARAALRALDWPLVQETIEAMPPAERHEAAWRYWLARAHAAAGKPAAALPLRESLARENHFYGMLAAEELAIETAVNWQAVTPAPADLEFVGALPGVKRALALYRLNLKAEGLREWNLAMGNLNDAQLLAAASIALAAGLPDRAIGAADRTLSLHDFNARYPLPHQRQMDSVSRARQLDEAWMYGLIRQESRFMADAHSQAGARGLMQLMPATARWAAKQAGVKGFSPARVNDVDLNLELGAYYLRHVLDGLKHPVLATAAYNAGPGRARRWRGEQALEGAIYAESIPFPETRDYVKKVMVNAWYYARRLGSRELSLKSLMGTVPARDNSEAAVQLAGAR